MCGHYHNTLSFLVEPVLLRRQRRNPCRKRKAIAGDALFFYGVNYVGVYVLGCTKRCKKLISIFSIYVFRPLTWLKYGKVRHRQREKHSHESVKNGRHTTRTSLLPVDCDGQLG